MTKIFNAFQLKILALTLMLLEHVSAYLPSLFPQGFPLYFQTLGRIVVPIFFFLAVESFYHTGDRGRYLKRLYIAAIMMFVGNYILEKGISFFVHPEYLYVVGHNIFLTIAVGVTTLVLIENYKKLTTRSRRALGIVGIILSTFAMLLVESSFIGVGIFYSFYFFRNNRKIQYALFALCSFLVFLICVTQDSQYSVVYQYQWAMVFAIPFLALYNGKRGRQSKYLFYALYPAHIWILYTLSFLFPN